MLAEWVGGGGGQVYVRGEKHMATALAEPLVSNGWAISLLLHT